MQPMIECSCQRNMAQERISDCENSGRDQLELKHELISLAGGGGEG